MTDAINSTDDDDDTIEWIATLDFDPIAWTNGREPDWTRYAEDLQPLFRMVWAICLQSKPQVIEMLNRFGGGSVTNTLLEAVDNAIDGWEADLEFLNSARARLLTIACAAIAHNDQKVRQ